MYKATINDTIFEVNFSDEKGLKGSINGQLFEMDFIESGHSNHLISEGRSYRIECVELNKEDKTCIVKVNNKEILVSVKDRYDDLLEKLGMDQLKNQKINELKAPMPGLVIDVLVENGQTVCKGDSLLVLEAMKMENSLKSPTDGVIASIEVKKSNAVEKNQVLIRFA